MDRLLFRLMKKLSLLAVLLGILATSALAKAPEPQTDFYKTLRDASKEEKLAFILLGRAGCSICHATKEIAGEFMFKVRVESQNRTYEVPVEQELYEMKKVGDEVTFLRPPSEQH